MASVLAVIGMYVFLRYQTPVYNVRRRCGQGGREEGANAANGLAAIQDLGMLSMTSNFTANEVEILRSTR